MSDLPDFVDIHCHLAPGLDDGAAGWDEALAMAQMAVRDGFSTVIATPHQLGGYLDNHGNLIRERVAEFQQRLDAHQIQLQVLPGADVRIEPEMVPRITSGEVVTLADRGRHVLLELPHELFVRFDSLLDELDCAGMEGILSHPERNRGLLCEPGMLDPLVEEGCLIQVTAGSLIGAFGPQVQAFANNMVEQG